MAVFGIVPNWATAMSAPPSRIANKVGTLILVHHFSVSFCRCLWLRVAIPVRKGVGNGDGRSCLDMPQDLATA
jgi:hypothetical protein